MAGKFDFLPRAKTIPIGREKEIPVIPITTVRSIPAIFFVSTGFSPKPPNNNHAAIKGNIDE